MCINALTITLTGNLIGLATKQFNSGNELSVLVPDLSVWVDSANQCSDCQPSFTSTIANKTYVVSSAEVTTEAFASGTNMIVNCKPTYTLEYQKNGVLIGSSPTWLTYNSLLQKFTYNIPTDETQIGTFTIKVTCTIGTFFTNFSFDILVKHSCNNTIFSAQTVNNMSYQIEAAAATQTTAFANTVATGKSNPTYCGANTFSFSPTKTFLSASGNIISVSTSNPADAVTSTIIVTVSLVDYPQVPSISKTFTITITCVVQTLTFSTATPASTTLQVGIDTQPFNIAYAIIQTPACGNTVTFSISPSQTFLSLPSPTSSTGGNVQINGATIANHNSYSQTLTATVDGKTATKDFIIIIKDPCSTAVFEIAPAGLINMNINVPSSATSTQTVVIKTDVQLAYPSIVCLFTLTTLTPSAAYISISTNIISINAALIQIPSDQGTHLCTLTVVSANFPGTVALKTYNFNVEVICAVTSLTRTSQVPNTTYTLNQGSFVTAVFTVAQAAACNYSFIYTFTFTKNGSGILQPTWLSWNNSTQKFSMTITAPADEGVYLVTSAATIPQNALSSNTVLSTNYSFTLTVQSDCVNTILRPLALNSMKVSVGNFIDTQSFMQVTDLVAIQQNNPQYCGPRAYEFTLQNAFLSIVDPSNPWGGELYNINLQTNDFNMVGNYTMTLKTSLLNYLLVTPLLSSFQVSIGMNHPPFFKPNITEIISIQMTNTQQIWFYKLPQIIDEDSADVVLLTVDLGYAANFATLRENKAFIDISDISSLGFSNIRPGFFPIVFTLNDGIVKSVFKSLLFILAAPALPKQIEPIVTKACDPQLNVPIVVESYSYLSGQLAIKVTWDRFTISGEGCTQEKLVTLKVTTLWHDHRFPEEANWLQYVKSDLDNTKQTNYVSVVSEAIYDIKLDTTITVEALIEGTEIKSSFTVAVSILPAKRPVQDKNQGKFKPRIPTFKLESISPSGLLKLVFQDPIMVFNRKNDAFMINPLKFLQLKVFKNPKSQYSEDPEYINSGLVLTANVTNYSSREIQIQCEFSNAIYISLDPLNPDELEVRVINPNTFVSAIDFQTTVLLESFSKVNIQRQLSLEMAQRAKSVEKKQKVLVNTISSSSFTVNILLGVSLQYLWGMVNVLQFVIYMNQWKVNWPPNANLAVKTLRTIALGEFIDTKKVQNSILTFYGIQTGGHSQQIDDQPVEAQSDAELLDPGYSDRILQDEVEKRPVGVKVRSTAIAVSIIILVVVVLALAFTVYIFYQTNKWFKTKFIQILRQTKGSIFWNGLIRFYLQSFLKYTMAIGLAFFHPKTDSNSDKAKLAVYVALALVLFIVIPFLIQKTLRKHRYGLYLSLNKKRIGSLYLGIKTKEFNTIFCVFSFLLVRLLFAILTYSAENSPGILVNFFMLLNNFNIIYIGWFSPYETRAHNNIELFNSFMMQVISYHLLLLANLLETPLQEYNVGWSIITCIGVFFVVNMGYMVWLSLSTLFRILYLRRLKNRAEKLRKQKLEQKEKEARETSNLVEIKIKQQDALQPTALIVQGEPKMRLEDIPQPIQIVAKTQVIQPLKKQLSKKQAQKVKIQVQQSLDRISEVNESIDEEAKVPKRVHFQDQSNVPNRVCYQDASDKWDNVYFISNPSMAQYINMPVLLQEKEESDQVFVNSESLINSDQLDSRALENQQEV